jgi:hypothetical protein
VYAESGLLGRYSEAERFAVVRIPVPEVGDWDVLVSFSFLPLSLLGSVVWERKELMWDRSRLKRVGFVERYVYIRT